jgi:hypothetical protein
VSVSHKVCFLDFDGVVARAISGASAHERLVPEWIARLSKLVERTDCRVVVSSTWRQNPQTKEGFTVSQLTAALRARGFTGTVFDITPMHEDVTYAEDIARVRGGEILAWLRAQKQKPTSFVALDDVRLLGPIAPYVVQTNEYRGLSDADVERAVTMLAKPLRGRRPWTPLHEQALLLPGIGPVNYPGLKAGAF